MKPTPPLAARSWATRGLSATRLGVLFAWATLIGCTSSGGNGAPSTVCTGDACPAQTPPCAGDADCDAAQFCAEGVCQADVCSQGKTDCDPKSGELRVCADNGSTSESAACPASETCVAGKGGAACQAWLCSPGQASCTGDSKATRTCADDGLSYGAENKCSKGTSCVSGKCQKLTCTPNQLFCQNGGSYVCSGDGASAELQTICDSASLCDAELGQCRPKPCAPGSKTCIDQAAATCNALGTGYDKTECALNEVCEEGSCKPAVCAPGEVYCESTQVAKQCNAAGTAAMTYTTCVGPTHCSSYGSGFASCASNDCTPGADLCDGTRATVCKSDGTGPALGGTDCALVGGSCSGGKCKAPACTPNQRFCYNRSVYLCASDGSGSALYAQCASTCNPATANCTTQACTPSALSCSGNTVVQCDVNGLSTAGVQNCATNNQVCVAGHCQPTVCTPYAYACKNGNVYTCSSDGTGDALSQVCNSGTYCSAGYCMTQACTPGSAVCNGNALTTCKSDGSGPADTGVACAAGNICDKGTCKPTVCSPNGYFCSNGDARLCNAQGTASTLYQHCFSDFYCSNGSCLTDVCPNAAPYCSGETLLTCKADGSGPSGAGTDCSASGKLCDSTGCVSSLVDTIGVALGSYQFATFAGQIIRTQRSRKLTRVELNTANASTIQSTFVYSSTDGVNFYLVGNTPPSATATFPAGFNDSGPLSITLQANTYYLVGESLASGLVYADPSTPTTLSFATVQKGVLQNSTFTAPSSFAPTQSAFSVNMRLTTALP